MARWYNRLLDVINRRPDKTSYLRSIVTGALYKISDIRGDTALANIRTQIDTMRALAKDSQISTALSYYATDATTPNTDGDIIWAVPLDENSSDVADIVNELLKKWQVNKYARDHILELATIGNLYVPTTDMYKPVVSPEASEHVALGSNSIENVEYDVIPAYAIPPENIVHLWLEGEPQGFIVESEEGEQHYGNNKYTLYPESSIIHFTLGGLLGDYTVELQDKDGEQTEYDIQFAQPLMENATQPTQTLGLLEDALLLSSLNRMIKFINIDCGNTAEEDEIKDNLQQIKDAIEQQLALDTDSGDAQSFVNPKSPNNLIYLPKVNGQDAISITDLNMAEATDADNKLLDYYQNKKLSVLGIPKEAMNFSSSEGLGGAGAVMSQRSALYANALRRLETAYIEGWTDAINKHFEAVKYEGFKDKYILKMNPILTEMSTVQFERRDTSLGQAQTLIDILKGLGVKKQDIYESGLMEVLSEAFPRTGSNTSDWDINIDEASEQEGAMGGDF